MAISFKYLVNGSYGFMIILLLLFIKCVLLVTHPELYGIDEPPTLVTLVTTCLCITAVRTDSFYEAVCKEALAVFTMQLLHHVFY